jgi:Transposase, Mutator family
VLTDIGAVDLAVPRDRAGSFEPQIVRKGQTRLRGFNERIIALYARGMTTRDIRAHLREIYGVEVSADLISRVTDGVVEELAEWQSRPLDAVYPVIFTGRADGQDPRRGGHQPGRLPGHRDRLRGREAGPGPVGRADDRGVGEVLAVGAVGGQKPGCGRCVCIVCCDGLTGLPEAIGVVWPQAVVQLCVVHLIRASLRYASRKYWAPLAKDLRVIYTAADEQAAAAALEAFAASWQDRYPAIVRLWRAHWSEFIPFLAFPPEVRRVIYTTNLIESVNSRLRKVTRNRGQFPSEQAGRIQPARPQSPLPGRAQPGGVPRPECRDPQFGLETGAASVHDLLRGTNPNTMTDATIAYTDGRSDAPDRGAADVSEWPPLLSRDRAAGVDLVHGRGWSDGLGSSGVSYCPPQPDGPAAMAGPSAAAAHGGRRARGGAGDERAGRRPAQGTCGDKGGRVDQLRVLS